MALFIRYRRVEGRQASIVALLLSLLLAAGCAGGPIDAFSGGGERRAERLADSGRHADAASEYIGLASEAVGPERDRLTLLAVEQWLDAGDAERARNATASITRPSAPPLSTLWQTNAAALELYDGDADAALAILEPLSRQSLVQRDRLRVEALRADAWIQKRDPARSVELMRQRESWLERRSDIERNRLRLWQGLLYSDPTVLREAAERSSDAETRGWLALGALATATGRQGIGWNNGALRWRDNYPGHPATGLLGDLSRIETMSGEYPRQVALLLPLSGRYGDNGQAIRNGFLGAYFAAAGTLQEAQSLRIYDIETEGGASAAYQTAVEEGAEFVVGPLLRDSVAELANDILVPVPVLTLNYLPDDTLAPPGLYQFALAPEDEAASAAARAIAEGHRRAVAMVPNNDWGRRVLTSFATEFEGLGGQMLDYRDYQTGKQDFSAEIEGLMGLAGSVQRYRRLRANIGQYALQFDPRRRQDADFVFLAADVTHGRLLKSQLKFHYSGDLPVYATSTVNARDGRSNSDLNGILFADVPWLIDPEPWFQDLPVTYEKYWPQERRRLHAMGFDAYNLVALLYASRGGPIEETRGTTGRLYLDQYGRVHRKLAFAQFQDGVPTPLPRVDEGNRSLQELPDERSVIDPSAADEATWERNEGTP